MEKKILIVSYFYPPENTPRAFRTYELARELSKTNRITVMLPVMHGRTNNCKENIDVISVKPGFLFARSDKWRRTVSPGFSKEIAGNKKKTVLSVVKQCARFVYGQLCPENRYMEYFLTVFFELLKKRHQYDGIISIGLPFSTHLGVRMATVYRKSISPILIADYGDPFSGNAHHSFVWATIEKWVLKGFSYISIPHSKALQTYLKFKDEYSIKIIPQGFDFNEVKLSEKVENAVITFGYAGVLYKQLREPTPFLNYLSLNTDFKFKFIVYTRMDHGDTRQILASFETVLKDKLELRQAIPRLEVIYELSKMDFLVNIENKNEVQSPSKLIDYALTKRPIISFGENSFKEDEFVAFTQKDYSRAVKINLDDYDIRTVARKFNSLI